MKGAIGVFQPYFRDMLVKLQSGGMVPAGFPNDTFPAALSSGEFVVNNSLTPKLESFLDGQRSNNLEDKLETNNILLSQIADLLGEPQSVSTSVELDGNSLANAMLEISRNNLRTA